MLTEQNIVIDYIPSAATDKENRLSQKIFEITKKIIVAEKMVANAKEELKLYKDELARFLDQNAEEQKKPTVAKLANNLTLFEDK